MHSSWAATVCPGEQMSSRAPSTTALPSGHPGAVALVPCGTATAGEESLAAPALLIELLAAHSGAVWIDD